MSARSRYLEAVSSPRNEHRDDDNEVPPTAANNNNNNTAPSSFGLKRTSSVKSPSSISAQHVVNKKVVVGGGVSSPPPPPPPGVPIKRSRQQHNNNMNDATNNNNNNNNSKPVSPVRAGGEQWSPREEIQSGSVSKYKDMLWGNNNSNNNNNSSTNNKLPTAPDSPVVMAVKNLESSKTSPVRSPYGSGSGAAGGGGRRPPSPFYKRTAPPPIETTTPSNNHHNTNSSSNGGGRVVPTPPSRVFRQPRNTTSPNRVGSGGVGGTGGPSPLQQRKGNLNIAPLDTSFENNHRANNKTAAAGGGAGVGVGGVVGGVQNPPGDHQQQQQHPSNNNNQTQQQQQGITTITAFKRPGHKVGIIFTRLSSTSPDIAIIARILPESIFSKHDAAERNDQASYVASMNVPLSPAKLSGLTRGLEGSEVIAVNGIPVRNPRHAAEMVAKATEEVRLAIRKRVMDSSTIIGSGGGGGNKEESGVVVQGGGGGGGGGGGRRGASLSPKRMSSPKVPGLGNDDTNAHPHPSIDEESTFSVRTEQNNGGGVNVKAMADNLSQVTEDDSLVPPPSPKREQQQQQQEQQLFVVKRGSPKTTKKSQQQLPQQQQQQQFQQPKMSSVKEQIQKEKDVTAAAKKSKEIADMRRKVAQAMLMSQEMVDDPVADSSKGGEGDGKFGSNNDEEWRTTNTAVPTSPKMGVKNMKKMKNPPKSPVEPKSPGSILAERRRQAALDMYNSTEMVGDNVDDAALGRMTTKETIVGSSGGGIGAPAGAAAPLSDVGRVSSFGGKTDVTTESMATQRMGTTSPKRNDRSFDDDNEEEDEEGFKFDEEEYSGAMSSSKKEVEVVDEERKPPSAASIVAAGALEELQRGAAAKKNEDAVKNMAVSRKSAAIAAPPSPPVKESPSPSRRGLFGKMKSQKKSSSKMFGGVKKIVSLFSFVCCLCPSSLFWYFTNIFYLVISWTLF